MRLSIATAISGVSALPGTAHAGEAASSDWSLQRALCDPEGLTVSGSMRVRYEALANQFRPGLDRKDDIVLIRTQLRAEYDAGAMRVGGELQDSRAYAADQGSSVGTGQVNAFELVQAYVGLDFEQGLGASIDIGRFTMDMGSRRLVARNNFRNTTNAFTGAMVRLHAGRRSNFALFYTMPQQRLPSDKASVLNNEVKWDREGNDLIFWGVFFGTAELPNNTKLELYLYGLDEDDTAKRQTRNRKLYTPGIRIVRNPAPGQLDYEWEAAYQFGHIRNSTASDAPKTDVSAWFTHAELGWQWDAPWRPRISAEFDIASGDHAGGTFGRFDTLFGARRGDFGPTSIYGPLGRSNIISPGLRFEAKFSKRLDGLLGYRAAWLDSASDRFASTGVRDPLGHSGKFCGHQLELRARYWLVPGVLRAELGGAVFLRGGFLKEAPNANGFGDTTYGYSSLTANF